MQMCRRIVIISTVLLLLAAFYLSKTHPLRSYSHTNLKINNQTIRLYLADTETKRERGLSGVPYLAKNEGMLFIFDRPDLYAFWMKEMKFPLDIIFVNHVQVVDIFANLSPDTYPQSFQPKADANCVIELKAGQAKKFGLLIGSKLGFADNLCR